MKTGYGIHRREVTLMTAYEIEPDKQELGEICLEKVVEIIKKM